MHRVIEQTDEEKIEMYMKMPQKDVVIMLIESHKILDILMSKMKFSNNHKTIKR